MFLTLCPFLLPPGQSFPSLSWGSRWVGVGSKALPGCGYSSKPQGPTYSLNEGTHHLQRIQAGQLDRRPTMGQAEFWGSSQGCRQRYRPPLINGVLQCPWEMHWHPGYRGDESAPRSQTTPADLSEPKDETTSYLFIYLKSLWNKLGVKWVEG